MQNNLSKYYSILKLDESVSITDIENRRDELITQLKEKDAKFKRNYQKDIANVTIASNILIENKKNQEASKEDPDNYEYNFMLKIGVLVMFVIICVINIISLL